MKKDRFYEQKQGCLTCDKIFRPRSMNHRYCSVECRVARRKNRISIIKQEREEQPVYVKYYRDGQVVHSERF